MTERGCYWKTPPIAMSLVVTKVYNQVIEEVIEGSRDEFKEEEIHESVLEDLRAVCVAASILL